MNLPAIDAARLPITPIATFQAFGDVDEDVCGPASRDNGAAANQLETTTRKFNAAQQKATRSAPSLESSTLLAGFVRSFVSACLCMYLCQ